jgi:hypothetical protein
MYRKTRGVKGDVTWKPCTLCGDHDAVTMGIQLGSQDDVL